MARKAGRRECPILSVFVLADNPLLATEDQVSQGFATSQSIAIVALLGRCLGDRLQLSLRRATSCSRSAIVRSAAPCCCRTSSWARRPSSAAKAGSVRQRRTNDSRSCSFLTTTAASRLSSRVTMSRKFQVLGPNELPRRRRPARSCSGRRAASGCRRRRRCSPCPTSGRARRRHRRAGCGARVSGQWPRGAVAELRAALPRKRRGGRAVRRRRQSVRDGGGRESVEAGKLDARALKDAEGERFFGLLRAAGEKDDVVRRQCRRAGRAAAFQRMLRLVRAPSNLIEPVTCTRCEARRREHGTARRILRSGRRSDRFATERGATSQRMRR